MKKLRAVAFSLLVATSQLLSAAAWAQGNNPAPAAPKRDDGPRPQPMFPDLDVCKPVGLLPTRLPPDMAPPQDWRGRHLEMYVRIRQDGSVEDINLLRRSGSDALDQAAMAQVRQVWRWAPLACGRRSGTEKVTLRIPRATCQASGWTPRPPLALAQPGRDINAGVDVMVGPDGRMVETRIVDSNANAALDAALLAFVQQNWRFYPLAEGCGNDLYHSLVRFPEASCVPKPVTTSRTLPDVARPDRPRAVDLQIGVDEDGKPLFANVIHSSGDAGLDAAAAAHVQAAWRWEPITCGRAQPGLRERLIPLVDTARVAFSAG